MANEGEDHALVADEEAPTEFALMANTESKVFDNSLCSKDCKKNNDSLKSKIIDLTNELSKANNYIYHYKLAVTQLEGRLVEYKERKVKYIKKIRTLEFYRESNKERIESLSKQLETLKLEKDGVDGKLAALLKALKNLDNLIESQRSDKIMDRVGYSAVPPPASDLYLSPKKDLSWIGIPKFADDTVTDYSRPSPTVESTSEEGQNKNSSTSEDVASPIKPKSYVKFVKSKDFQSESKINKKETPKKPQVKYDEQYRQSNRKPNMRGNQRNWNNLKCYQLEKGTTRSQNNAYMRPPHRPVSHRPHGTLMRSTHRPVSSQNNIDDKGYWDNGCSRHMTGNISYLFDLSHLIEDMCLLVKEDARLLAKEPLKLDARTKDETSGILKKFINEIENLKELKVKIIRCDNGGEFRNKELNDFCSQKGIKREFSNVRTPQQNRVAERKNRTLIEVARTMLADAKLPVTFWAEAVNTAWYVQNRVLVNKSQNKTSYELFNGRTPAIGFLKPFGCHVMILNTLDHLGKFKAKGDEVDAGTNSTNLSGTKDLTNQEVKKEVSSLRYIALPNWVHDALLESSSSKPQDGCSSKVPKGSGNINLTASITNPLANQMETLTVETSIPTISLPVPTACLNDSQEPSSDARLISKRVANQEETPSLDNILSLTNQFEDILGVESSPDEAIGVEADVNNMETTITASPTPTLRIHKDHPKSQIIGPIDTLIQTRHKSKETLVDCLKGVRPIGTKWVLKNKKDKRGIVVRNKARLVAQGHTQEEGIDYDKVFAPVARIEAIRLFLAYASFMRFTVYQMDVKSVFLYGTIDEEVGTIDQTLFIRRQRGDFILIQSTSPTEEGRHFSLTGQVCRRYSQEIGYLDVRSSNTPMDKENPWGKDRTRKDVDIHLYRSMIGSLMYLTASRPDIMFAVCACARHQVTPKECHLHAVKRIFRYLKGHPKLGLWYPKESPFDLVAYSDSDYGGATQDRKSTTGGSQFLAAVDKFCGFRISCLIMGTSKYWGVLRMLMIGLRLIPLGEYNTDFHPMVDFIVASHLRYALTVKPTIFVSHIRQFWSTPRIETTDEGTYILATVDGIQRTVFESSLRRNLKLRDEDGFISIPDTELFENLTLMGYNISQNQKLTFKRVNFPIIGNEPASPVRDVSEWEACPTESGFIADQDWATIAKSSTLPYDLAPMVTSPAADEGRGIDVPTGSGSIPTAGPPATVIFIGSKKEHQVYGRIVGNKMHKAFPLPVKIVATARRNVKPLPKVCNAIEKKKKKLPIKDRWQLH
nr:hypothetical protein [Tanacetum cinerariifolium]